MVCKYLGKFHSAERYYRQALRCAGQLEGQKRNHLIADLFHNLGGVEHSRGRFARGERYARKGLRLRLQFSAAGSPAVASDLAGLAAILYGLGKVDEAGKLYRRALSIYRKHLRQVLRDSIECRLRGALPHRLNSYARFALASSRAHGTRSPPTQQ